MSVLSTAKDTHVTSFEFCQYGRKNDIVVERCMKCNTSFSINTNTTVVKNRLRNHGYFLEDSVQKIFGTTSEPVRSTPLPREHKRVLMKKKLVNWVVMTLQPFSAVDHDTFNRMLTFANPELTAANRGIYSWMYIGACFKVEATDTSDAE